MDTPSETVLKQMSQDYIFFVFRTDDAGIPELIVGITKDFETEFGPSYDPKSAAKVFWQCAAINAPPINNLAAQEIEHVAKEIQAIFPQDSSGWTTCVLVARELNTRAALLRQNIKANTKSEEA